MCLFLPQTFQSIKLSMITCPKTSLFCTHVSLKAVFYPQHTSDINSVPLFDLQEKCAYISYSLPSPPLSRPPLKGGLFSSSPRGDSRKHWNPTPLCVRSNDVYEPPLHAEKNLSFRLASLAPTLHTHTNTHKHTKTLLQMLTYKYSQGRCKGSSRDRKQLIEAQTKPFILKLHTYSWHSVWLRVHTSACCV